MAATCFSSSRRDCWLAASAALACSTWRRRRERAFDGLLGRRQFGEPATRGLSGRIELL